MAPKKINLIMKLLVETDSSWNLYDLIVYIMIRDLNNVELEPCREEETWKNFDMREKRDNSGRSALALASRFAGSGSKTGVVLWSYGLWRRKWKISNDLRM